MHLVAEKIVVKKVYQRQIDQKNFRFALEKQSEKLNFQSFFTSKKHFDVYFQWNAYVYSWKYVVKQGEPTPNWSKLFQTFWSHSSVLVLEKNSENLNCQSSFTFKKPFGGNFKRNKCTYFKNYIVKIGLQTPKWAEAFLIFWPNCSIFSLEKQTEKLNFHSYFTSKKTFGG